VSTKIGKKVKRVDVGKGRLKSDWRSQYAELSLSRVSDYILLLPVSQSTWRSILVYCYVLMLGHFVTCFGFKVFLNAYLFVLTLCSQCST
jgi:hypothetical protein